MKNKRLPISVCNHNIKKAFSNKLNTHNIFGGAGERVYNSDIIKMGINLIINLQKDEVHTIKDTSTSLSVLNIYCPDFDVPLLYKADWLVITDNIRKHCNTLIMCAGGHGRTGTVLAIVGCLLEYIPERKCPVSWVKENYCSRAIESQDQRDYIGFITGRKIKSEYDTIHKLVCYLCSQPLTASKSIYTEGFLLCNNCDKYFYTKG